MILLIEESGVTLTDLDDLKRLSAQLGDWGRMTDGDLFVTVATLLRLAGERAADRQWRDRFDGMIEYARQHGWVHGDEVRLHVTTQEV
jgi:hypothetical protein